MSGRPTRPAHWTAERLARSPIVGEREDAGAGVALLQSGADPDESVVVLDGCLSEAMAPPDDFRRFAASLRPRDEFTDPVSAFVAEQLTPGPIVGVHVRHGNGGDIQGHAAHWTEPTRTLFDLIRVVQSVRSRVQSAVGAAPRILLCTDSVEVEQAIRSALPGVVARPKALPPAGSGELHRGPDAPEALAGRGGRDARARPQQRPDPLPGRQLLRHLGPTPEARPADPPRRPHTPELARLDLLRPRS